MSTSSNYTETFARKIINISRADYQDVISIVREVTSLRLLQGCLGCVEWEEDISLDTRRDELHLHMRYCNHRSLYDLINQYRGKGWVKHPLRQPSINLSYRTNLPESLVMRILEDLVNGIRSFHRLHIIHRDIKPENSKVLKI